MNNPGAHGFSEVLYEFSSASANNGSEFGGLNTAWGSYDPKSPEPPVPWNPPWDIATGLVMLLGRFLPVDRSHGHGRQPGGEETNSFYRGNDADRHIYFRLRAAGNDPPGGRVVVPAGGGPWPCRRTFWPLAVWRLSIDHVYMQFWNPQTPEPSPQELKLARRQSRKSSLFDPQLMKTAFWQSLVMLRPDIQWKNPVMFVVEIGTVMTLVYTVAKLFGATSAASLGYLLALDFWLVATLLFANFASSIAEARGKAQADALRKTRRATPARRRKADGSIEETVSTGAQVGRHCRGRCGRSDS